MMFPFHISFYFLPESRIMRKKQGEIKKRSHSLYPNNISSRVNNYLHYKPSVVSANCIESFIYVPLYMILLSLCGFQVVLCFFKPFSRSAWNYCLRMHYWFHLLHLSRWLESVINFGPCEYSRTGQWLHFQTVFISNMCKWNGFCCAKAVGK